MRRSPSARRTRATTSCEVGPTGLSRTRTPSINRPFHFLDEQLLQRIDATAHRASCRVLVAAAAVLLGHRADVDVALGPQADPVLFALDLLEEHDRLDLFDRERQV